MEPEIRVEERTEHRAVCRCGWGSGWIEDSEELAAEAGAIHLLDDHGVRPA